MIEGYNEIVLNQELSAAARVGEVRFSSSPFAAWNAGLRPYTRNSYAFAADAFEPDIHRFIDKGVRTVLLPGPGTSNGVPFPGIFSADILRDGMVRDGFVPLDMNEPAEVSIPMGQVLVACYYAKRDFNCYRFCEQDGLWYTKQGTIGLVTSFDLSGAPMRNLEKADKGAYAGLVGLFLSPRGRRQLAIGLLNNHRRLIAGNIVTSKKDGKAVCPYVREPSKRKDRPAETASSSL